MFQRVLLLVFLATAARTEVGVAEAGESARWQIAKSGDNWQLLKDGAPFYIKGAVGWNRFDVLRDCGGNAVRASATQATLDAAQQQNLFVMANLPVRGQRNGMDWGNDQQVAAQKERVLQVITELKDHPALMFWAVGNELDHIPGGTPYHPRLWERLNDLAAAIKQIDSRHPVLTVVGTGRFEQKVQQISAACPDMDLLGINSYGDIAVVTEQARRYWPKPYVIAEWGPTGHWQVPRTRWRAPLEQTSSQKADTIRERYENTILADRSNCLGSFVFYWSEKQETTHTWYGLFRDGLRTESIDVMQRSWSGAWPENRAPTIGQVIIEGHADPAAVYLRAGASYRATATAQDPDADPLSFSWEIRPEVIIPAGSYAGSLEKKAEPIPGLLKDSMVETVTFTAPERPGPYRIFVTIVDGHGHAAYGNVPFYVAEP